VKDDRLPILRAALAWLAILLLAVANGWLREAVLLPRLGTTPAFMLSALLLSVAIMAVAWLAWPWLGRPQRLAAVRVGAFWLVLTLLFEFGFGRWMQHKAWDELLAAYTFRDGNLWPLVLLVTLLAPLAVGRLRGP
jgi:hypothetical protein